MEVVEALNERQLTGGGDDVAARCRGDRGAPHNNGVVQQSQADAATDCSSLLENHSSMNDDDDDDDWTRRRPESVWLDYLYAWNPLAAGIVS